MISCFHFFASHHLIDLYGIFSRKISIYWFNKSFVEIIILNTSLHAIHIFNNDLVIVHRSSFILWVESKLLQNRRGFRWHCFRSHDMQIFNLSIQHNTTQHKKTFHAINVSKDHWAFEMNGIAWRFAKRKKNKINFCLLIQ